MKTSTIVSLASAIGLVLDCEAAHAQQASINAADTATPEIVVTAQRREQSVLSVPLSIQAASGDTLANNGVRDLTSLRYMVPGYFPSQNSGMTQVFIRGIGNAVQVGADPSVATFVDEIPRIYGTTSDNLVDVERVEVLKGAQGGLYGRNATGGVVNIITRKPSTTDLKGDFRFGYGEHDTFSAQGYINVPLSEKIAISFSADRESHGPYIQNIARKNPYTAAMFPNGSPPAYGGTPQGTADYLNASIQPSRLNNADFWAVRSKLLLAPTDNLSIILSGDFSDQDDTNGQGIQNTTPAYTRNALIGLFRSVGITANLPVGFLSTSDKFQAAEGFPVSVRTREFGFSSTITWNLPNVDLTSISSFRHQNTFFGGSSAVTDVGDVVADVRYPYKKNYYQELRAISTFSGPVRLIFGATYLDNRLKGETQLFRFTKDFRIADTRVENTIHNWSVYAQVEYDLAQNLTLIASGRYMHETNHALFTAPVISSTSSGEKKFVPSATLTYRLPDGNIFVRWARGFKTGGVNLAVAPAFFPNPSDGSIFGPETVDTYEGGFKTSLFNHRFSVTSTVFYNDYKDLQVNARGNASFPAITTAYINAKSARTYGVEGSLDWRATNWWTLGGNFGYLNAKFKDFKLTGSTVLAPFDRSNTVMPKSPKWQLTLYTNIDRPLNEKLRVVGRVLTTHSTKALYIQSAVPALLPDAVTPAYWIVNARLGVKTTDDKYGIALVADNVFNEAAYSFANSISLGNSLGNAVPRIIRAEVTVKF